MKRFYLMHFYLNILLSNRDECQKIADVFVKKGPFLKMYTDYIREFETICDALEDSRKRFPDFDKAVIEFEVFVNGLTKIDLTCLSISMICSVFPDTVDCLFL